MGKIYKIPVGKNRSSIDPVDRGYTLFFGCFSALVCFVFLEDSVIGAQVALLILLTPLLLLFVVGLFWDHHPKTVGFLSATIAVAALALSIFETGFVLYRSYIEEPSQQYCLGPLEDLNPLKCPILFYQERLAENPVLILNEIVPLLLCVLVFGYALIKALKLGRSSQDSEISN